MITFQLETWFNYYYDPERAALWQEHYDYLKLAHDGQMPMAPDAAFYEALDMAGLLRILTARDSGRLVGYVLVVVKRHPHYDEVCGFEDSYFLTRDARRGTAGYRMLQAALAQLRAEGIRRSYWMTKEFASVEKLLLRLGMKKMDTVYVHSTWETG